MQPDDVAIPVAHLAHEGRIPGLRLVVRQIGMEEQIGLGGDSEAAAREVVRSRRPRERLGRGENMLDLSGRIPLRRRRHRRRTPLGRARGDAGDLRRARDQSMAVEPGRLLDRADRPAAVVAVEVDPVTRMRTTQCDDAGAGVPRRVAPDVGEAPLVAGAAAAREEVGHPVHGGLAQTLDDQVEIVARRLEAKREGVVEVKQGSPAPIPRG